MRIVSGEKCSDLVLLCPNHRRTLRLYRDAKSLLADEAGSTQWSECCGSEQMDCELYG